MADCGKYTERRKKDMAEEIKITYKIYLEAEDVSQSRIMSTTSYFKNLFKNCTNHYLQAAEVDDECDMEDFTLRLYVEETIEEEKCSHSEDAKAFLGDMAEFLDAIAMAQSYLDMEGGFSVSYEGVEEEYTFASEAGKDFCDFFEVEESGK